MAKLVDYFVVCGIQGDRPLQETRNVPYSSHLPPFMRTYTPRVLARFPLIDHFGSAFDDGAVCALCAPEGVRFAKNLTDPKTLFHSFLITRENASRAHGAVLTYYERVEDSSLVTMLEGMQKHYSGDQDAEQPFQSARDKLFVTKSLCLLSSHPIMKPLQAYLEQLYAVTAGGKVAQLPVESYLFNLLYRVPMPRPGHKIVISGPLSSISWRRPSLAELPICDYSFTEFFELLGLKNIVKLLTCLLLEHQVLLKSADYQRLMLCAFCAVSLLFPFNWHHVFVPILPAAQVGFLDAPVPFLMGLHVDPLVTSRTNLLQLETSFCSVDIDHGTVDYTDDLVVLPDQDRLLTCVTAELKRHHVQAPDLCEVPLISGNRSTQGTDTLRKQLCVGVENSAVDDIIRRSELEEAVAQSPGVEETERWGYAPSSKDASLSSAVRQHFVNYFVEHFANYENFVITPQQSLEDWQKNRDQFQNFDKSAFLSDQPTSHWPFYSAFLESTLFSGFIDEKLLSQWKAGEASVSISLFDSYIERYKDKSGLSKPPTTPGVSSEGMLGNGLMMEGVKEVAPLPVLLEGMATDKVQCYEVFPPLDSFVMRPPLDRAEPSSHNRSPPPSPGHKSKPIGFFQSQVKFVNQLWRESRLRVKHMLGSTGESLNYIEENTHIAYLCELLERVWGHGLKKREGKSPLWTHLMAYAETKGEGPKLTAPTALTTSLVALDSIGEKSSPGSYLRKRFNLPQLKSQIQAVLQPPPTVLLNDLRIVAGMSELKTEVGRARAFVRLALEKKCLSRYLSELLSNKELMSQRYREYAFLCTDEEREQFLYHLLTLTARDFTCFTTGFLNTKMLYRVIVIGEGKHFGLSTSTLLVTLAGEYLDSGRHEIPRGEFSIDITTQNLGPLTCLRLGHDGTGLAPSLFVHAVLAHVVTTGQTYRFDCGCWLARNEGDGATERFLLGQTIPHTMKKDHSVSTLDVESVLPSRGRRLPKKAANEKTSEDLLATLGTVVNNLCENVKLRNKDAPMHRQDLLYLLCGANGFCSSMEELLLWQLKASRKFQKQLFVWDMFEYVLLQQQSGETVAAQNMTEVRSLVDTIVQINSSFPAVGKSEKLVILLCIGLRQHALVGWLKSLAAFPGILSMYEMGAFLIEPGLLKQATDILSQTHTVTVKTELLLTQGL